MTKTLPNGSLYSTLADVKAACERAEIGPEWTPCVKRPVTVHVRGQRPGEAHVSTREGLTPVKPDDLIMRGVDGEEYPIGRDLFNRTYSFKAALAEPEAEPDGSPVAQCESLTDADMALIAAAPELLAALQALVADYERLLVESRITKRDRETMIDRLPHYTEAARAAIAKALES